jgi:ELWxxDGT repeat protein
VTALGNGRTVFSAADPAHGREVWATDGTAAGTVRLANIASGAADSDVWWFAALGDGRALFSATDAAHGSELWVTDGISTGMRLVADLVPGAGSSLLQDVGALGGGVRCSRRVTRPGAPISG